MANKNTKRAKAHDRRLSKKGLGPNDQFIHGKVPFGHTVNSSLERKRSGKKPYDAPTK